jgi:hypothetical protein
MRLLRVVVPVLLLAVLGVQTAKAQNRRTGFWISGGLGAGVNSSKSLDGERLGGGAGYLRLGGTLADGKLLLGGEFNGWVRSRNSIGHMRTNTTFTAIVYPSPVGGFFLKGGVGVSVIRVSTDVLGVAVSGTEEGFGGTLGLGYDIPVGASVSLTPNLDMLFQSFDGGAGNETNTILLLTIGITGH